VLGFRLQQRFQDQAAFMAADGYHHHIGLNIWESAGGAPPAPGTTGLYHFAILYPTRADLARALRRLLDHGVRLDGASDHGVSEALYLHDRIDTSKHGNEPSAPPPRDPGLALAAGSAARTHACRSHRPARLAVARAAPASADCDRGFLSTSRIFAT
jgi:catechol 2,3-dioxygenase